VTDPGPGTERLAALEREVAALREAVRRLEEARVAPAAGPHGRAVRARRERDSARTLPEPGAPPARRGTAAVLEGGDPWRWLGTALLLLGVGFGFKYSIDRGWLTEPVRVGCGVLLAAVLLTLSGRLPTARRAFARVLDGSAVATLYITGFAAFQLYGLVPHGVAFGALVCVALMCFALSYRQDDPSLAVIGTAGALGTPFLLQRETGSVPGLVAYTCVVLAAAGAVYLHRGWRSLHGLATAGGWAVLALALAGGPHREEQSAARSALQAGIAFAALLATGLPLVRAGAGARPGPELALAAVTTPLVALALSSLLWDLERAAWGLLCLAAAGLHAVAAAACDRSARLGRAAPPHALAAGVLAALGLALALDGAWVLVALAGEGLALAVLAPRWRDRGLQALCHALFAWAALLCGAHLLFPDAGDRLALGSGLALSDLFAIAAAAAASLRVPGPAVRGAYRLGVHLAVLAWLHRELAPLPNGEALVSAAWGAWALAVLVVGLRRDLPGARTAGRLTLFAVVAKLFLVDLVEVDALWRILSFLVFGAVFLALSYWLRDLWRPVPADAGPGEPDRPQ